MVEEMKLYLDGFVYARDCIIVQRENIGNLSAQLIEYEEIVDFDLWLLKVDFWFCFLRQVFTE